jgi:hypothetical protein
MDGIAVPRAKRTLMIRNSAWFRFSFQWPDPKTGEKQSRAGMQSYRIEDGKLVETWITMRPLGTSWTDLPQERWTSAKK